MPSPPPLLCINLARSPERWAKMQAEARAEFGDRPDVLTRIDAVDGTAPDEALAARLAAAVTLRTRLGLLHRVGICDPTQLTSTAAVAAFLSHRACWEWLVARPDVPAAVVLEDDVCLAGLRAALAPWGDGAAALADGADGVDFVVCGYYPWRLQRQGPGRAPHPPPRWRGRLRRMQRFHGAHCYVVTQRGARRLLALSVPLEMHVDFFLGACCYADGVAGFLLRRSAIQQCRLLQGNTIPHYRWGEINVKMGLPDVSVTHFVLGCLALVVLVVVVVLAVRCLRRRGRGRAPVADAPGVHRFFPYQARITADGRGWPGS